MSLEWQNSKTEIPKPVEKTESIETIQNLEREFSPEQIEQIMERVKDINEYGTAFTGIAVGQKLEIVKEDGNKKFFEHRGELLELNEESILKLSCEALFGTLHDGLLSNNVPRISNDKDTEKIIDRKERWIQQARKDRTATLSASIIGRDVKDMQETYFGHSNTVFNTKGNFGVIYNLDNYTETFPHIFLNDLYLNEKEKGTNKNALEKIKSAKTHTFRDLHTAFFSPLGKATVYIVNKLNIDTSNLDYKTFAEIITSKKDEVARLIGDFNTNEIGRYGERYSPHHSKLDRLNMEKPHDIEEYLDTIQNSRNFGELMGNSDGEDGFVIRHRVAPRNFKGIVIKCQKKKYGYGEDVHEDTDKERQQIIQGAIDVMKKNSEEANKDLFLPLYDFEGNLLWPKKMSYEEVKKFTAEKSAKNTNMKRTAVIDKNQMAS